METLDKSKKHSDTGQLKSPESSDHRSSKNATIHKIDKHSKKNKHLKSDKHPKSNKCPKPDKQIQTDKLTNELMDLKSSNNLSSKLIQIDSKNNSNQENKNVNNHGDDICPRCNEAYDR